MLKVKRVLISVSDKTGLVEFVKGLQAFDVEILSTGGTAKQFLPWRGVPLFWHAARAMSRSASVSSRTALVIGPLLRRR